MPYTILCSPQQQAGAQHGLFGFPGEQLVPVALLLLAGECGEPQG